MVEKNQILISLQQMKVRQEHNNKPCQSMSISIHNLQLHQCTRQNLKPLVSFKLAIEATIIMIGKKLRQSFGTSCLSQIWNARGSNSDVESNHHISHLIHLQHCIRNSAHWTRVTSKYYELIYKDRYCCCCAIRCVILSIQFSKHAAYKNRIKIVATSSGIFTYLPLDLFFIWMYAKIWTAIKSP